MEQIHFDLLFEYVVLIEGRFGEVSVEWFQASSMQEAEQFALNRAWAHDEYFTRAAVYSLRQMSPFREWLRPMF